MEVESDGFFLRPIQLNDDSSKLSLGDPAFTPLKTFLAHDAKDFHERQIAKTFVLMKNGSPRIYGYITIVNSEASLANDQRPQAPLRASRYSTFPAVKIARLAIDKSLRGRGFGKMLVVWAVNHVCTIIMPNVGCRFVVVDSKRASVGFYEHLGFVLVNGQENIPDETRMMFFDLDRVNKISEKEHMQPELEMDVALSD